MDNTNLLIGVQTTDLPTLSVGGIVGTSVNIGGLLIRSERGIEKPVRIKDTLTFYKKYGKEKNNYYGHSQVRLFFDNLRNEPGELYVRRVLGAGKQTASVTLNNLGGVPSWKILAGQKGEEDPGVWGNNVYVAITSTSRGNSVSTAAVLTGDTKIKVNNLTPFKVYDLIQIGTGSGAHKTKIIKLDEVTNEIYISDPFTTGFAVNTPVAVHDRALYVYYKDPLTGAVNLVESWTFLTLDNDSEHSIIKQINDPVLGSNYIKIELIDNSHSNTYNDLSVFTGTGLGGFTDAVQLNGGADGAVPNNSDYKEALEDFRYLDVFFISNAEVFSEGIANDGEAFCANQGKMLWIGNAPLNIQNDEEALFLFADKRKKSDRVYAIFYKDWVIVDDPNGVGLNPTKVVPVVGAVMGYWIYVALNRGIHKVPASTILTLTGIRKIYNETIDRKKLTEFGNAGLNPISNINGEFAIRDSQTPSKKPEFRFVNAIAMSIYFKRTFEKSFEYLENEPNNIALLNKIKDEMTNFAYNFYISSSNGGTEGGFASFFKPNGSQSTFADVVKIIADSSINKQETLFKGILYVNFYFMAPPPARSILIGVGLMFQK